MPRRRGQFREAARRARARTDAKLAGEEPKVMSWEELRKSLPARMDQDNLDELMKIVNSATSHNKKVASLISNISKLGGTIVKLLRRVP